MLQDWQQLVCERPNLTEQPKPAGLTILVLTTVRWATGEVQEDSTNHLPKAPSASEG